MCGRSSTGSSATTCGLRRGQETRSTDILAHRSLSRISRAHIVRVLAGTLPVRQGRTDFSRSAFLVLEQSVESQREILDPPRIMFPIADDSFAANRCRNHRRGSATECWPIGPYHSTSTAAQQSRKARNTRAVLFKLAVTMRWPSGENTVFRAKTTRS